MINRTFLIAIFSFLITTCSFAQTSQSNKVSESIFTLTTFAEDGSLLSSTHGIFVSNDGYAIAAWKPFVGATKAVVVDAKGKKYDVDGLVGANDLYNVCKFKVNAKTTGAVIADNALAENAQIWLACYTVGKPKLLRANVKAVEKFMETMNFYIATISMPDDADYCPLLTTDGKVIALAQKTSKDGEVHGVDANLAAKFFVSSMSTANETLQKSLVPVLFPTDTKEAQLSLLLAAQQRKGKAYEVEVDKFIDKFPTLADGYQARARVYLNKEMITEATADMDKALQYAEDKADMHYSYADLILQKVFYMNHLEDPAWTLESALEQIRKATALSDMPIFKDKEGEILFSMQRFDEAYNIFMQLQSTHLASPETLNKALQCMERSEKNFDERMALMDSIVNSCPHPLTFQSGPYLLKRAMMYHNHGDYRKALQEYLDYEKLMVGNHIPAEFYYTRFTCCKDGKIFQQALDDINKAISLAPNNTVYYCEKASLLFRLNKLEDAINSAQQALLLDPKNADAHAVKGAAQCQMGKKYEGLLNIEQAKEYGYEGADELMKRYK